MVIVIMHFPTEMKTPNTGISRAGGGVFAGLRTAPKMSTTSRMMLPDSFEMDAQTGMKRSSTYREARKRKILRRIAARASPKRSQA